MENHATMIVKDVVDRILESKENGTYDELLKKCKSHHAVFLESIHHVNDKEAVLMKLEHFDRLPGSYQLSCFLACYDGVGAFNTLPQTISLQSTLRPLLLLRPILRMDQGVESPSELYKMLGNDHKDYMKVLHGQDFQVNQEVSGSIIENHWPATWKDSMYSTIKKSRPVLQRFLQPQEWWEAKGYTLLDIRNEPRFFAPEDCSIMDCIIFPKRLLDVQNSIGLPQEDFCNDIENTENGEECVMTDKDCPAHGLSSGNLAVEDNDTGGYTRILEETLAGIENHPWATENSDNFEDKETVQKIATAVTEDECLIGFDDIFGEWEDSDKSDETLNTETSKVMETGDNDVLEEYDWPEDVDFD